MVLDEVFGADAFRNEIVWKRPDCAQRIVQGAMHFGDDSAKRFFSTAKSAEDGHGTCNICRLRQTTMDKMASSLEDGTGRRYNKADITGPGWRGQGEPSLRMEEVIHPTPGPFQKRKWKNWTRGSN